MNDPASDADPTDLPETPDPPGTPGTTTGQHRPRQREDERAVRRYLEALQTKTSYRGPYRSPEALAERLGQIDEELVEARSIARLHLLQERRDVKVQLARSTKRTDFVRCEQEFIRVARAYGERQGIAYSSWRVLGVSAPVLAKAKIVGRRGRPKANPDAKANPGGRLPASAAPEST